ncbi:hypothetical protein [Aliikangiella sp. IMCC44359]|uniref:hypothetical protein n=1 Tax=Aliikangiella sp. IMCC44359 TaxID=3459125 RepID=UPI00403A99B9
MTKLSIFRSLASIGVVSCLVTSAYAGNQASDSEWSSQQINSILDNTIVLDFAPDISHLSKNERLALEHLKKAGEIIHDIYLKAQHKQALATRSKLTKRAAKGDKKAKDLLKLYRIFKGPIASTLENKHEAFAHVAPEVPGKNRYPWGITKQEVSQFLAKYPEEKDSILHVRTLVRKNTTANIKQDLSTLTRYPTLDILHPGLKNKLTQLNKSQKSLYAIPYSIAYADQLMQVYYELFKASDAIRSEDRDFADYLENRARDLLSDNYESGDAAWITGSFGNINAQIGSYETYDDALFSTKSSFSMSILIKDRKRSEELQQAIGGLQALENSLPYNNHKTVRSNIPLGVYNVLIDYAQSRGTNTASILPNESHLTRKYGRVILLRYNVLTSPEIFSIAKSLWDTVMADEFDSHLTIQSNFKRTLWHEIGHYMGPAVDKKGRTFDIALENNQNLLEEMKSDLVSLFSADLLHKKGHHTDQDLQAIYAGGIARTLLTNKPRRSQSYGTMKLMTMNFFLEHGAISFNRDKAELSIDYKAYPKAVKKLLKKLLDLQYQGDKAEADRFIDQYTNWDTNLHEVLAQKMKKQKQPRYRLVKYKTLGE